MMLICPGTPGFTIGATLGEMRLSVKSAFHNRGT